MRVLNMNEAVAYLEGANVEHSENLGFAVVHRGTSNTGLKFVLINDWQGNTTVVESL